MDDLLGLLAFIFFMALPFVVVGSAIGLLIYLFVLQSRREKKRTQDLDQVAHELDLQFYPRGDPAFLGDLQGFHLFSLGRSVTLWNLMWGRSRGLEIAVFDYRYVTGHGKSRRAWNHSVVWFHFDGPRLPTFALRPENFWHTIGEWFGYQDIDFASHPAFSNSYLLRANNEDAIRDLFTDRVLEFYEDHQGLCTEVSGNTLLFYRHLERVPPDRIQSFIDQGLEVLALFHPRG